MSEVPSVDQMLRIKAVELAVELFKVHQGQNFNDLSKNIYGFIKGETK